MDSAVYFFASIHRIAYPTYVPSEEDVLRVRSKSTAIMETRFWMGLVVRLLYPVISACPRLPTDPPPSFVFYVFSIPTLIPSPRSVHTCLPRAARWSHLSPSLRRCVACTSAPLPFLCTSCSDSSRLLLRPIGPVSFLHYVTHIMLHYTTLPTLHYTTQRSTTHTRSRVQSRSSTPHSCPSPHLFPPRLSTRLSCLLTVSHIHIHTHIPPRLLLPFRHILLVPALFYHPPLFPH
ncbi:hypothetical protein B0H17DRAFT_1206494 [Mycena rosella]|uniref:Uncharacterized protein n=1 Tax=Mycena rosella TaxID=1033263 RepID=A0AAD7D5C5_MYCRO|nr:hypothetical protein B0H17DRAFT_1206494 [Mycena rosella]